MPRLSPLTEGIARQVGSRLPNRGENYLIKHPITLQAPGSKFSVQRADILGVREDKKTSPTLSGQIE